MDSGEFAKGQLFNIAVRETSGETLVLLDVDIRPGGIDFVKHIREADMPFISFNRLDRGNIIAPMEYEVTKPGKICGDLGGVMCLTRQQFVAANGFSNLYFGYGFEDHCITIRTGFRRIPGRVLHIEHPVVARNPPLFEHNRLMAKTEVTRTWQKDGMKQTRCRMLGKPVAPYGSPEERGIMFLSVWDVYVDDDFEYMDLYKEGRALCPKM
jgi:hypothetical protein